MKRVIRASNGTKPWSAAEDKRSKAISDKIISLQFAGDGDFEEYYESAVGDEVATFDLEISGRRTTQVVVCKEWMIYASNWDENERKVKKGAKVPGTIYFTVADDGDVIDENYVGYATKEDAIHAAQIYIDEMKQRFTK